MDWGKYTFYIGTARGILLSTSEKIKDTKVSKHDSFSEITCLNFGRTESELILGFKNGNVTFYNSDTNTFGKDITKLSGEGPVIGLGVADQSLIIGKHDGIVNIWNGKKSDFFSLNLDERGTLDSLVYNQNRKNVIGTGGEFYDFKLWDIETKDCVFRAKSMGHDELQLPIPTSVRGITFLSESEHLAVCATKEGHVLLYDDRAQRRPVVKFLEKKASYTCITSAYRERQVLVGTTRGYMQLLDMKAGKCVKTFTTFTGCVTSIACDPLEPIVATTSLDRFLRIHNLDTKEVLHKVYMKQSLTQLLMRPVIKDEEEENLKQENEPVDEEYEELFNNMEEIQSTEVIKKKKNMENSADTSILSIDKDEKKKKRKSIGGVEQKKQRKKKVKVVN